MATEQEPHDMPLILICTRIVLVKTPYGDFMYWGARSDLGGLWSAHAEHALLTDEMEHYIP